MSYDAKRTVDETEVVDSTTKGSLDYSKDTYTSKASQLKSNEDSLLTVDMNVYSILCQILTQLRLLNTRLEEFTWSGITEKDIG